MPRFDEDSASGPIKVLVAGDSGTGKTGLLASLALAGYSLRILDYDNGTQIIKSILRAKDKSALANVYAEPLTDTFKNLNGRLVPKSGKAWSRGVKLLSNWTVGEEGQPGFYNLGPVTSWDTKCVLCIDSLQHMGHAAMRFHHALNGKLGTHPTLPDWGIVQTMMEELLSMLYDDEVQCNVVVNTHVDWRTKEIWNEKKTLVIDREITSAFPSAPGRKLPEKLGSYFNNLLQVIVEGTGSARRHKLVTVPPSVLGLKTSSPFTVKKSYSIETGLADFFKDLRGEP